MNTIEISIVVPVYNSERCVDALARRVAEALGTVPFELVMVNDRSTDGSWECIVAATERDPRIVGINLRKNSGQDNAIMAGFRHARGAYMVVMDDDLQHDPADIVRLWDACRAAGADVCFARFTGKRQAWWKNIGSWLNDIVARVVVGKPRHVYLSPFKIIRRDVVEEMVKYDGPFPYVDGLLFTITDNVTQIDAEHHARHAGRGNYNLIRSITVTAKLATTFSVMPLRFASLLGFVTAAAGFLLGIYFVLEAVYIDKPIQGWPSTIVIMIFLGGVTLVSIGLVGEYIGRLYIRVNNRPQYTVKDVVRSRAPEC